ncbi:acylphosphatase [Pontiella agarivorans]|uniref:acylphosphatase n=1 Tax=Pontiella agarivorans TaxID=3038953 RepID=A0ABU5MTX7_9BACT|nr:acylphosphatase [Pontiella agarivorans]MDZ8117665.1 acylphosphatase [Pontiella agarivorans]
MRCGINKAMSSEDRDRQLHAFFSGRVQGVGFRYTVCELASSFAITGFVKNMWDGDVELVAEGTHQELVDFLNCIKTSQLGRKITNARVGWHDATNRFKQFGIEF